MKCCKEKNDKNTKVTMRSCETSARLPLSFKRRTTVWKFRTKVGLARSIVYNVSSPYYFSIVHIRVHIKPTPFLTSPNFPRVKPRSSGSCVCDDEFPIAIWNCALAWLLFCCWLLSVSLPSHFLSSFLPSCLLPSLLTFFRADRAHLSNEGCCAQLTVGVWKKLLSLLLC